MRYLIFLFLFLSFIHNVYSAAAKEETLFEKVLYRVGVATDFPLPLSRLIAEYRGGYPLKHTNCLLGHTGPIRGVVDTEDGHIASASEDETVRVWNKESAECTKVLQHNTPVNCLAVAAGLLASGSDDGKVRRWNPQSGECVNEWTHVDGGAVLCLAALPDGSLASGSESGSIEICDPLTGDCLRKLHHHKGAVTGLAVSREGMLASCSKDTTVRVCKPDTGKCLQEFEYHSDPVLKVMFRSDDTLVSSSGKAVFLSHAKAGKYLQRLRPCHGNIQHLMNASALAWQKREWGHDHLALYICGQHKTRLFSFRSGKCFKTLLHTSPDSSIANMALYRQGNNQASLVDCMAKLSNDSLVWSNTHNKQVTVLEDDGQGFDNGFGSARSGNVVQKIALDDVRGVEALQDGGLICTRGAKSNYALEIFSPEEPMIDEKAFALGIQKYAKKKKDDFCIIS